MLAEAGFDVLMVEEGGYYTSTTSRCASATRRRASTKRAARARRRIAAISVLQGKAVGGTTVVNWTTSFRTPEDVVQTWHDKHAVKGFAYADLGAALGRHRGAARASRRSTSIDERQQPEALRRLQGARLGGRHAQAQRLRVLADGLLRARLPRQRQALDARHDDPRRHRRGRAPRLPRARRPARDRRATRSRSSRARSSTKRASARPARSSRSRPSASSRAAAPSTRPPCSFDPGIDDGARRRAHVPSPRHRQRSRSTTTRSIPFRGAPQSAASHHFAHRATTSASSSRRRPGTRRWRRRRVPGFGAAHLGDARAVQEDRHPHRSRASTASTTTSPGGRVTLRPSGMPLLDYPIPPRLWSTFRIAQKKLAEMQLASGAKDVFSRCTTHRSPSRTRPTSTASIDQAPYDVGRLPVFTAHQMGGCGDGRRPVARGRPQRGSPAPPHREPLRHRRLGLSDEPRRQPPGVDLRARAPDGDAPRGAKVVRASGFATLFVLGAVVLTLLDSVHVHTHTLVYAHPVVFGSAWWVPLLMGSAAAFGGFGVRHRVGTPRWAREAPAVEQGRPRARVVRARCTQRAVFCRGRR